jgi:hypothetical protein
MYDILEMKNTITEDEYDKYKTSGCTKPCDDRDRDHDHAQVQAESEITESANAEIQERSLQSSPLISTTHQTLN